MSEEKDSVNIIELIVALTGICVVAAVALAGVYQVTKEPIAVQRQRAKMEALKAVLPAYDNEPDKDSASFIIGKDQKGRDKVITFYRASQGGNPVGTAFTVAGKGFGGDINIMIGVSPQETILNIQILSHKETPGLGAKIDNSAFLNQFIGKSLVSKLAIKRDGGEIDQITGASISSRAAVEAIKNGLEAYQKEYGEQGK